MIARSNQRAATLGRNAGSCPAFFYSRVGVGVRSDYVAFRRTHGPIEESADGWMRWGRRRFDSGTRDFVELRIDEDSNESHQQEKQATL